MTDHYNFDHGAFCLRLRNLGCLKDDHRLCALKAERDNLSPTPVRRRPQLPRAAYPVWGEYARF